MRRNSCSCCSSNASVVQALQAENKSLTAALVEMTATLASHIRKLNDALLTPGAHQIERVMGEQRIEQAGREPVMPQIIGGRFVQNVEEEPQFTATMPHMSGGMGA